MKIPDQIQSRVWRWHNRRIDDKVAGTVSAQVWSHVDRQLRNQFWDQVYDQLSQEFDTW